MSAFGPLDFVNKNKCSGERFGKVEDGLQRLNFV